MRREGAESTEGGWRGASGALPSPLFEKRSVHSEAQHGAHGGTEAGSQPEGGVLQVRLGHVPVTDRRRWRECMFLITSGCQEGGGPVISSEDHKDLPPSSADFWILSYNPSALAGITMC